MPNAVLSRCRWSVFSRRDRMLIQSVIGVRYETSPEQLRYLLVRIRETLLGHPTIRPDRVRVAICRFRRLIAGH